MERRVPLDLDTEELGRIPCEEAGKEEIGRLNPSGTKALPVHSRLEPLGPGKGKCTREVDGCAS